jgi:hypothetical protein
MTLRATTPSPMGMPAAEAAAAEAAATDDDDEADESDDAPAVGDFSFELPPGPTRH